MSASAMRPPGRNTRKISDVERITFTATVKADAPRAQLEELCEYVQRTSPVLDIIRNPVPVSIRLVTE